jgi:hypothetical protein
MKTPTAVLAAALLATADVAWAQARAGAEFRVNTYTTGGQYVAGVGGDADGNFVVVWGDGEQGEVRLQRFSRGGARLGAELVVDTLPAGSSRFPALAVGSRGNFVVAWSELPEPGGAGEGIRAAVFDAAGNRLGPEFAVNTYTTGRQSQPDLAMDETGSFVVTWTSYHDGSGAGVFAQRFAADGSPRGGEFRVNTNTAGTQFIGTVAARRDGHFIVAWSDLGIGRVVAKRYDPDGNVVGAEFTVNSATTGYQFAPGIGFAPDGSFVVAFASSERDGDNAAQMARRFDRDANPVGPEFQVNTQAVNRQAYGWVSHDALGNFVVQWVDFAGDGSDGAVKARRYQADGTPRGPEFLVNTYTTGFQASGNGSPSLFSDAAGNLVVGWSSAHDGGGFGVFAQRFGGLRPHAMAVDLARNGVIEPGETVDVRPAWSNASGANQFPGGVLSNVDGPTGTAYAITDAAATYVVDNNASGTCNDCYAVSVATPPSRPALHWDATADERLTPDTQGQVARWRLHIGGSFTDVSAGSPFYRFIETLLHHGITGGCAAEQYCPASLTTRESMAVFVLVAREGTGYAPPACTTPVFGDVPAASPFCRWVEELARRGVVSGCGGGDYCPGAAVTREQMAVFVLRTLDGTLSPPLCTTPVFNDVPASSPFCRWIEELARRGVVSGCGGGRYCPADPVTREQMGVFISATFGLTLYGP